jgi:hypothetical protein
MPDYILCDHRARQIGGFTGSAFFGYRVVNDHK